MAKKRGQISTEYILLVGFIVFLVISTLGIAFIYTAEIKDEINFDEVERFANKVTSSAESVFYAGEPSRITIVGYVPEGVTSIQILSDQIVFNISTISGRNSLSYVSNVPLQGTISNTFGTKKLRIEAQQNQVTITETN